MKAPGHVNHPLLEAFIDSVLGYRFLSLLCKCWKLLHEGSAVSARHKTVQHSAEKEIS